MQDNELNSKMSKLCVFYVSWHFPYQYRFEFECAVQTSMLQWHRFCLHRLSYSVTSSGSCQTRPSLSPAVIVFLQVCLLTGFRLCLTELLQPVRTGLSLAVRLNTFIKGHKAQPLLWTRQTENIFHYLLCLLLCHEASAYSFCKTGTTVHFWEVVV